MKLIRDNSIKSRKGFTLLEVIVAVAILGTSVAVLLGAVNRNLVLNFKSKNLIIANTLAQRKMSEIELAGFPEVVSMDGDFEDNPGFLWFLNIEPAEMPGIETSLMLAELVITWDEGNQSLALYYVMSEYE